MDALTSQCANQSVGPANQLFGLLIQTLLAAQCSISSPDMWPTDFGPTAVEKGLEDYDFIVVGAGSAGSVVASRLSENPNWKVLLLEAGGDPPIESEIPFMCLAMPNSTADWGYSYEQSHKGSKGSSRKTTEGSCPRGKVLGGSSAINFLIYVRGNPRDFDDWQSMGNPSWGWTDVLEYFKKSENNLIPDVDSKYHGIDGPLTINVGNNQDKFKQILLDAGQELGYKTLNDISEEFIGFLSPGMLTVENGRRSSAAKAFLSPAKDRPNLHVIKHAHVTKIDFDANKMATGVQFVINGTHNLVAKTTKEIILSAGTIGTPQLLLLSGIGQDKHLRKLQITTIADLQVGKSLQDHVYVPIMYKMKPDPNVQNDKPLQDYFDYLMYGTGPFSDSGAFDVIGFFNSINATDKYPDIQTHYLIFKQGQADVMRMFLGSINYDTTIIESLVEINREFDLIYVIGIALNPKSLGTVKLRSIDPFEHPIIQPNYLNKREDTQTLLQALKLLRKFVSTSTFQTNDIAEVQVNLPECLSPYGTDLYWECYIRHMSSHVHHPVGTAKMGPETDRYAVVDARLKVRGVSGLRVADASIMPKIVSGNTNAATIMIGERASDFIKQDWPITADATHGEL